MEKLTFTVSAADKVDRFVKIVDVDVNDRGLGAAKPVGSPYATVLLALPAVSGVNTGFVILRAFVQLSVCS